MIDQEAKELHRMTAAIEVEKAHCRERSTQFWLPGLKTDQAQVTLNETAKAFCLMWISQYFHTIFTDLQCILQYKPHFGNRELLSQSPIRNSR